MKRVESVIPWLRKDATCHLPGSFENSQFTPLSPKGFTEDMQAHLRYGFYALISWLFMTYGYKDTNDHHKRPTFRRFHIFKKLVEQHFVEWKSVNTYAMKMGCTEKSLTRAVLDAEGITAKEYVLRRLGLEAKRLLIHTDWPIGAIADKLGFKEATHFSKFFKRTVGCTPQDFRSSDG